MVKEYFVKAGQKWLVIKWQNSNSRVIVSCRNKIAQNIDNLIHRCKKVIATI